MCTEHFGHFLQRKAGASIGALLASCCALPLAAPTAHRFHCPCPTRSALVGCSYFQAFCTRDRGTVRSGAWRRHPVIVGMMEAGAIRAHSASGCCWRQLDEPRRAAACHVHVHIGGRGRFRSGQRPSTFVPIMHFRKHVMGSCLPHRQLRMGKSCMAQRTVNAGCAPHATWQRQVYKPVTQHCLPWPMKPRNTVHCHLQNTGTPACSGMYRRGRKNW